MFRKLLRKRWTCFLYDGRVWRKTKARMGDSGIEFRHAGTWVTITQEITYELGRVLIVAVEPVALSDHTALERARHQIALHALFESGGDMMRYLQIGAVVVPLLVAVYLSYKIAAVDDLVTSVKAVLALLENSPIIKR